jgi:PPM family protein phosphatase
MKRSLRYAVVSEPGFTRHGNEDSAFAGQRLIAVADGMGGEAAGEVASRLVIAELMSLNDGSGSGDLLGELTEAAGRANAAVARHVADNPADKGMGTTLTAILFEQDEAALVHVGDSRAYLLRDGTLRQLTKDETLVQSLVDEGLITSEQARTDPRRSMVLRAIQGDDLEPSVQSLEVHAGDRLLICSDGVTDFMSSDEIVEALGNDDPQDAAQELAGRALRAGSRDNVTCLVAEVVDGDSGYDIPLVMGAVGRGAVLAQRLS